MVDSESAVLPAPAAFDPADSGDSSTESESDAPFASRPSRPFQDNGWMDGDHYSEADVPTDCHNASEWTEKYKDRCPTSFGVASNGIMIISLAGCRPACAYLGINGRLRSCTIRNIRSSIAQPGVSSISSLSGNDDSTNSQVDIADSVAAETIAALESGSDSMLLDTDADAMESDGDESGDGDENDAPLIEL